MVTESNGSASEPRQRELHRFIWILALSAIAAVVASVSLDDSRIEPWGVVIGTGAVALTQARSTLIRLRGPRTEALSHDDVLFPFLLVFLGPAGAVVSMVCGTFAANLITRKVAIKAVYNVSQFAFSVGLAAGVLWLLDGALRPDLGIFAVLAASTLFTVVNIGLFARLLHHLGGEPWWSLVRNEIAVEGQRYGSEVLLGVTAAAAVEATPVVAPIAALAVLVVLETHRRWFLIVRDRERLEDLLSTTASLHGAVAVEQVQEALVDAIRMMTGAEAVFSTRSDLAESGVALEVDTGGEGTQMLSVSRRQPLGDTEVVIIETLVRVAEVSMRIAALVELYAEQSEELANLVEERERFLTGTAHQLRTPLTAVLGFGQIIAQEPGDSQAVAEMAQHVVQEAFEMSNALDNLLIASRSVLDSLLVEPSHVELDREATRVASEFHLIGSIPVSGRGLAVGDPVRVRQTLRNLIRNASQHGGGSGNVIVAVGEADGWAYVDVIDSGPGVPEDEIETLFLPFTHAHRVAGQPGATGLGLHAARQLARLMHGEITYRREDGRTIFRLALPTARVTNASH